MFKNSERSYVLAALGDPGEPAAVKAAAKAGRAGGYIVGDVGDDENAAAGYNDCKGFTAGFLPAMKRHGKGWTHGVSISQEFGTVPGTLVIKALARDNAAFCHGGSARECACASQGVRDAFYVRTPAWQESVMCRGLQVLKLTTAHLAAHKALADPWPEIGVSVI